MPLVDHFNDRRYENQADSDANICDFAGRLSPRCSRGSARFIFIALCGSSSSVCSQYQNAQHLFICALLTPSSTKAVSQFHVVTEDINCVYSYILCVKIIRQLHIPIHYIRCKLGISDIYGNIRKYYSLFNSVLSVLGKYSHEMATLHFAKSYGLSALLYGCETWRSTSFDLHKTSVAWNNSFLNFFLLLGGKCEAITVLWSATNVVFSSSTLAAVLAKDDCQ